MPVVGIKLVLTPAWMNVWNINNVASPLKEIFKNWLSWLKQFLIILKEIYKKIQEYDHKRTKKMKWQDKKLNVLIPMAGAGSRFEKAGYTFPKPLIEIHGKPMIQVVVDNLCLDSSYTFIVQKNHQEKSW